MPIFRAEPTRNLSTPPRAHVAFKQAVRMLDTLHDGMQNDAVFYCFHNEHARASDAEMCLNVSGKADPVSV